AVAKRPLAKAPVTKGARRPKAATPPAVVPQPDPAADAALADTARRLAADIERGLAEGRTLSPEALHALLAALSRHYGPHVEARPGGPPLQEGGPARNTRLQVQGRRVSALGHPRRVGARLVAELDRPLNEPRSQERRQGPHR